MCARQWAGKPALLQVIPFPALAGKPAMMPGPQISANVHARAWWELPTPQHEIVQRDAALTGFCVRAVTVNVSDKMPKFFQKDACFLHIAEPFREAHLDQRGPAWLTFQAVILAEEDLVIFAVQGWLFEGMAQLTGKIGYASKCAELCGGATLVLRSILG